MKILPSHPTHLLWLLLILPLLLCGCGSEKPHGIYVGRLENGRTHIELRYDFKKDGDATFVLNSGAGAIVVRGRWRTEKGKVYFDGIFDNPVAKKAEEFNSSLHFDGDDLFQDNLALRLVRQK